MTISNTVSILQLVRDSSYLISCDLGFKKRPDICKVSVPFNLPYVLHNSHQTLTKPQSQLH